MEIQEDLVSQGSADIYNTWVLCVRDQITMELCSQQGDGDFFVVEEILALFLRGGLLHCESRYARYSKIGLYQ